MDQMPRCQYRRVGVVQTAEVVQIAGVVQTAGVVHMMEGVQTAAVAASE